MAETEEIQISISLDDGSVREGFARIKKSGEDTSQGLDKSFGSLTKTLVGLAAAYLSIAGVRNLFGGAIEAAENQEVALNRLNNALKIAGTFSEQASQSFQDLATQIQATTVIEDDQVLALAALARNFTKTNEEAQKLVKASIDLASATGVDASTALNQLGGTLNGVTGRLSRLIPQVGQLTEEQLKAGAAVELFANRFAGAAQGEVNTFSGRLAQLRNSFGDFLEELGGIVTRSPAVLQVLGFLTSKIREFTETFKDAVGGRDIAQTVIVGLAQIGQAFVTFVLAPAELVANGVGIVFNTIRGFIQSFVNDFASVASSIASFISPDSAIAQNLKAFAESSQATLQSFAEQASPAKLLDFSIAEKSNEFLLELQTLAENARAPAETLANNITAPITDALNKSQESIQQAFRQGILRVVSGGVTALVGALARGKNGFEAFAGAVLGIVGDIAIQIGTTLFGIGIGIDAIKLSLGELNGGRAIAAGLTLIAIGALLKSLSGGGTQSATSGPVAAGPGGGFVPTDQNLNPGDDINDAERQRVTVNIQGDVLDSRESGLRIVELIQDAFDTQGAAVRVT